jgi:enediyne polyketide synthase
VVEQWRGLRLQAVRKLDGTGPWLPVLLGPYLERKVEPVLGTGIRVAVSPTGAPVAAQLLQRDRGALALSGPSWVPGGTVGSQDADAAASGPVVITSQAAGLAFAVASDRQVSGAVEVADPRPDEEAVALLGTDGLALARRLADRGESFPVAVARVYGAMESLRRSGQGPGLVTDVAGTWPGQWVVLRSGGMMIASFATRLLSVASPVVFTILAGEAA